MITFLALALLQPEANSEAPQPKYDLYLLCEGGLTAQVPTTSNNASVTDNYGRATSVQIKDAETQFIPGTVSFRLQGDAAEVNIPSQYLGIKRGNAGWFKLKDLFVTDDDITGKVQSGLMAASSLRIDRRTGMMTSSGGFSGVCKPIDSAARKF